MPELATSAAPTCEAKTRLVDSARDSFPPYCRRAVALGSFIDARGIRRYHCQAEGHRARVEQTYGIASIETGVAVFDAPRCWFCKRTAPILDGRYTAIDFGGRLGIQHVCSDCSDKADDAHIDGGRYGDIPVEWS